MEAMGVLGFIFGLAGFSYANAVKSDIAKLRQEFEDFKASLNTSEKSDIKGAEE
ncbi:hypothetical protein Q4575_07245 [Psychrosphaera sp. 1_MG-2023]|uniref:Uncharacterized protein n=1 Tax=Psychrosphaera algicola TaxID=3023714 RepID=A0ABT5FEE5_9GAMM|nr:MULTISPECIES: hypothetical protein [unclassified Psychrosphaera]MDC2889010.1 hypothetical protein [Psychrosphaera sp. G1-22]MDO6719188.1 hypothetical protein [Psychrosphaera sp. 1_MG-2023]